MISRRKFFSNAVVTAGAAVLGATTVSAEETEPSQPHESPQKMNGNAQSDQQDYPPGEPGKDYTPVITPNGSTLPFKVIGGVKVFHLIAEEVSSRRVVQERETGSKICFTIGLILPGWFSF